MKLHIPVVDRKKAKFNRSCSVLTKDRIPLAAALSTPFDSTWHLRILCVRIHVKRRMLQAPARQEPRPLETEGRGLTWLTIA